MGSQELHHPLNLDPSKWSHAHPDLGLAVEQAGDVRPH